jgi:hypothetical protein
MEVKNTELPAKKVGDPVSPSHLVRIIQNSLDGDSVKPSWFPELDNLARLIERVDNGGSVRLTPSDNCGEDKSISYSRDVGECMAGKSEGRLKYTEWSSSCFAQPNNQKQLPDNEEMAIPQLELTQWWIGNERGEDQGLIKQIKNIANFLSTDLPNQANERFSHDVDRKQGCVNYAVNFGERILNWDMESVTVKLQKVWWDKSMRKPKYDSVVSARISKLFNGNTKITIVGKRQFEDREKREFLLDDPILFNSFTGWVEKTVDRSNKIQKGKR